MKKYVYLTLIFILSSCSKELKTGEQIGQESRWQGFEIIVIDSCEYINQFEGGNSGYRFTHKGNCKFCVERSKK
jgi:hypothetical protein